MSAAAVAAEKAVAEAVFRLPTVKSSPTIEQYAKHKLREKPYYTPHFTMTKEKWQKTLAALWFRKTDPLMPVYPYGKNFHYPEANYGLYGGATLMSGNKISQGRNKGKTVRKWFPNIKMQTVHSDALDKDLTIPIRSRVMRTIQKVGGLDNYVLGERPARIKELGLTGWKIRWMVMTSPKMQKKYAQERKKLGLPESYSAIERFEDAWNDPARREEMLKEQDKAWQRMRQKLEKWDTHIQQYWTESDKKHAGLKDSYVSDKDKRPFTLLDTIPSQMQMPEKIKEIPYEQFEKLPKMLQEGQAQQVDVPT